MSKRTFLVAMAFALVVALAAGGLMASNMGFKLNFQLIGPNGGVPTQEQTSGPVGSADGTNSLALPFLRQSGVSTAKQLLNDISANVPAVQNAQLLRRDDNTLCTYSGVKGTPCSTNFTLTAGLGYRVKVSATGNYIVVGSHDPALGLTFLGPNSAVPTQEQTSGPVGSADGTNDFAYPYHSTASTAKNLLNQIAGSVQNAQLLRRDDNTLCTYSGVKGTPCSTNFTLTPGITYRVKVSADTPFTPPHY